MWPKYHYNIAVKFQPITAPLEFHQVKDWEDLRGNVKQVQNKLQYGNKRLKSIFNGVIIGHKNSKLKPKLKASSALIKVQWPNGPSVNVSLTLWWWSVHIRSGGINTRLRSPGLQAWAEPGECLITLLSVPPGTSRNSGSTVVWVTLCSRPWLLRL